MKTEQLEKFFSKIKLFKDLDENERKSIYKFIEIRKYKKGDFVFEQNTSRKNIFFVFEGEIELFKTGNFDKVEPLTVFGKGDFFGEGSLMDDYPHSTSARALVDSTLYALSRDHFYSMMDESPKVVVKVLSRVSRNISRRMRETSNKVVASAAQYISGKTRLEHDLLGDKEVLHEVYYGVQTMRAMENFNITGISINHFKELIIALAQVKLAAVKANFDVGLIAPKVAEAISQACEEIIAGKMHTHFVVDVIQGGAGTSTNMNANEVIANRALEIMGYEKGEYVHCHPNNHINLSQSTNDVYPTALKIAIIYATRDMIEALKELLRAFRKKGEEFSQVIKMGRTQLQDAVPMTLGQEFEAYAVTLEEEIARIDQNARLFLEINMGGTAIGTGINANKRYRDSVVEHLWEITGLPVKLASNLVEATQDTGAFVIYSSALKRLAVKLSKICNDLRLLSSGPRAGLSEINLPKMQPGSSIMPGKVNPVIPEVVNQIAFKVIGNDLTVTMAAEAGQLQLNVMEPIIGQSIFESINILKNGMLTLKYRCVDGITANEKRCREMVTNSIGIVTALNPVLGYEACSSLAKEALETERSLYDLTLEKGLLTKDELDKLLLPENMINME